MQLFYEKFDEFLNKNDSQIRLRLDQRAHTTLELNNTAIREIRAHFARIYAQNYTLASPNSMVIHAL